MTKEKRAFIQELLKQGVVAPGPVQRALKERFGSGVSIGELAPFIRGRGKAPARTGRSKPSVSRNGSGPGRRPAATPEAPLPAPVDPADAQYIVKWTTRGEIASHQVGSLTEAERAVEVAVQAGAAPSSVVVYRRRQTAIEVKAKIAGPEKLATAPIETPTEPSTAPPSSLDRVHGAYGRAMFAGQSLERLIRTLLWGEGGRGAAFEAEPARRARRKKLAKATFGQVVQQLERVLPDHSSLILRLKKALKFRARLARSFFTETALLQSLQSEEGRREVILQCESAESEARSLWNEVRALAPDALAGIGPLEDETWSRSGTNTREAESTV